MSRRWLLLIYTVPTTPSRTRAFVWREIRREGALLLRDGVAALPDNAAARAWAADAARRIAVGGGTATPATATFRPADERRLITAFQGERRREYAEITSACQALSTHVAREREHAEFSFEELEELEAELGKIRRWFAAVHERDRFATRAGQAAARAITTCERKVGRFAERASEADLPTNATRPLAARGAAVRKPRPRSRTIRP